jgi:IS30 family transposase
VDLRSRRARQIQDLIREVLVKHWDPLCVVESELPRSEYDAYIGGVYRLLSIGASEAELAEHLASVERDALGSAVSAHSRLGVARRLRELDVRLRPS